MESWRNLLHMDAQVDWFSSSERLFNELDMQLASSAENLLLLTWQTTSSRYILQHALFKPNVCTFGLNSSSSDFSVTVVYSTIFPSSRHCVYFAELSWFNGLPHYRLPDVLQTVYFISSVQLCTILPYSLNITELFQRKGKKEFNKTINAGSLVYCWKQKKHWFLFD